MLTNEPAAAGRITTVTTASRRWPGCQHRATWSLPVVTAPCVVEDVTTATPTGSTPLRITFWATAVPLLVTVNKSTTSWPSAPGFGTAVPTTRRSAEATTAVVSVTALFNVLGSVSVAVTRAVLVRAALVAVGITLIVTVATAFEASEPRLAVIVPLLFVTEPWDAVGAGEGHAGRQHVGQHHVGGLGRAVVGDVDAIAQQAVDRRGLGRNRRERHAQVGRGADVNAASENSDVLPPAARVGRRGRDQTELGGRAGQGGREAGVPGGVGRHLDRAGERAASPGRGEVDRVVGEKLDDERGVGRAVEPAP